MRAITFEDRYVELKEEIEQLKILIVELQKEIKILKEGTSI